MSGDIVEALARNVALIAVVLIVYLLPIGIAFERRHRNRNAIAIADVLLGWTVIGWIAVLIWSFTANVEPRPREMHA